MNDDQILKRKPRKCLKCEFSSVALILYGMPAYDEELERKLENRLLVLGGCVASYDDPMWQYTGCGKDFYEWNNLRNPNMVLGASD